MQCALLMPKGKNIAISELRALSTGCCQSFGDGDMERRLHKHVNTPQYNQQGFLEDLLKNIALMYFQTLNIYQHQPTGTFSR